MNNLAKYRAKHMLTQTRLGEMGGVSKACISYMEKGGISAQNAIKYAEILGENAFEIMGRDVLKMIPKTEADKAALIALIERL